MKKSLFTLVLMMLTIALYSQEPPSSVALSLKGGLQFPGPGQPNINGNEFELKTSPFIKGDLDGILVPKLSMGLYFCYTPMKVEEFDENNNFFSVGMTIKPRFTVAEGVQVVPGVAIGYNHIKNDLMEDPSNGLNVGFQIEVSKQMKDNLGIVGEFGFFSQPVGGDGNIDITFPPIMYLCVGIQFGK